MRLKALIIPALLISLLSFPSICFASTVQYMTNDYGSKSSNLWYSDVTTYMNNCGYSYSRISDPSASTILNNMGNKDIFVWSGHGESGKMVTTGSFHVYGKNTIYCIEDDLNSGSFTNEIVWFQGCDQASYSSSNGNLLFECRDKSSYGGKFYGVDMTYLWASGRTWNFETWKNMAVNSFSFDEAIFVGANKAGEHDWMGFNSSHVLTVGS
ncbi:MAG: hypothetical protein U9N81_08020 [Bacillota bacterium]|nr:hypothetical protein [Bacillota bacterium]